MTGEAYLQYVEKMKKQREAEEERSLAYKIATTNYKDILLKHKENEEKLRQRRTLAQNQLQHSVDKLQAVGALSHPTAERKGSTEEAALRSREASVGKQAGPIEAEKKEVGPGEYDFSVKVSKVDHLEDYLTMDPKLRKKKKKVEPKLTLKVISSMMKYKKKISSSIEALREQGDNYYEAEDRHGEKVRRKKKALDVPLRLSHAEDWTHRPERPQLDSCLAPSNPYRYMKYEPEQAQEEGQGESSNSDDV